MATAFAGISPRAQQLVTWVTARSNPASPFTTADAASAIDSRRHALATALELELAGLVQRNDATFIPLPAILESPSGGRAAGMDVEPAVPRSSHAAQLCPNAPAGGPAPRSVLSSSSDLRVRQRALILRGSGSAIAASPRGASLSEGETYAPVITTNSSVYGFFEGLGDIGGEYEGGKKGEGEAILESAAPATQTVSDPAYIQPGSRNGKCIYGDSGKRVYKETRQRAAVYTPGKMTVAKAQARRVIASHTTSPVALSLGGEADSSRAYGIAVAFEELFGVFIGKPTLRFLKGHALGQFHQHQNFAHWLRAANIADELGVGYLTFIKAQFWAFNAWYGRAPKPHELGSRTGKNDSAERVRQFLEAVASGTVDPERAIQSKTREVVDTTTARGRSTARTKVDPALKAQHSEAQLRSLMKNYAMSEEDIFRTFAKGANAYVYFDRKWMLDHPTYQRLRAAGEL